jgi:hypothetical protein
VSTALECLQALSDGGEAAHRGGSSVGTSGGSGSAGRRVLEHAVVTACAVAQRWSEIQQRNAVKRQQAEQGAAGRLSGSSNLGRPVAAVLSRRASQAVSASSGADSWRASGLTLGSAG